MRNSALKLMPFQKEGVRFLVMDPQDPGFPVDIDPAYGVASRFTKLLGDDMGLGKTIQAIAALNVIKAAHVLVICPATVKLHWARQIAQWGDNAQGVYIVNGGKCDIPPWATTIVVNYELVLVDRIFRQLKSRGQNTPFDAVIMDEAHYLKGMEAKRTRRILGKGSFLHQCRYKWALTGTPILNRPAELYPLLYSLAKQCIEPYVSWEAFGMHFCNGHRDRKCKKCGASWRSTDEYCPNCKGRSALRQGFNMNGHSHTAELSKRLSSFMLRRKKEDVLDQLPDKVESVIEFDIPIPAGVETEPMATARRLLAVAKIPQAVSFISDLLNDVEKVVVFAYHREVIEQIHKALGDYSPVLIYGGMTSDEKQESIDSFITNPSVQVIIAQVVAGGTGVDGLQGVCNHAVFVELDWSPGIMDQAVDRLRRIGQRDTVFVYYLSVPGTLDTQISKSLEYKRHVISQIIKAKEVQNTMSTLTPEQNVALVQALTGINATLEAIASAFDIAVPPTAPAPAPAKAPTKRQSPAAKAAAVTPDPEITGLDTSLPEPPAPATKTVVSDEDFRKACGVFLATKGTDRDLNKKLIKEVIFPMFDVTSLDDVKPDQYAEIIEALGKGPSAYSLPGASSEDLSGI